MISFSPEAPDCIVEVAVLASCGGGTQDLSIWSLLFWSSLSSLLLENFCNWLGDPSDSIGRFCCGTLLALLGIMVYSALSRFRSQLSEK